MAAEKPCEPTSTACSTLASAAAPGEPGDTLDGAADVSSVSCSDTAVGADVALALAPTLRLGVGVAEAEAAALTEGAAVAVAAVAGAGASGGGPAPSDTAEK